jgi:hypothetical protein
MRWSPSRRTATSLFATIRVVDGGEGPGFGSMIGLVAVVVASVILVFFGLGYVLGRLFL